ncbi:hypothetical protein ACFWVC_16940 [Streptomyces sp. NPDC058691]|uniref:hypothetical protein n=1 Tax=Streptomyces sp. NPDC058691 TaxID=3346601 RepID=UPI00365F261A
MTWSIAAIWHAWTARRQGWDPDIVRALRLPVPSPVQDSARALIHAGRRNDAVDHVRQSTGYNRRDARCIALALQYGWRLPFPRGSRPARRSGR